jgi:outer membrane protein OmpA-like peptidoglycan-associated protein
MKSLRASFSTIVIATLIAGCASDQNKDTTAGAGIGAAAGALAGAVIGNQSGHKGEGALIGALVGGGIGGLVGHRMDKQRQELEKIAETRRTDQGLIMKLRNDILFDTSRTDLKPQAKTNLAQMAAIMAKYPEDILAVKGYTDSTGSAKVNKDLSERRAMAVKYELVNGHVPANSITVVGMGPENPVAPNNTNANRSKNRRVEIEITADQSKVPKQASN